MPQLFKNDGSASPGTFTEVTTTPFTQKDQQGAAVAFVDYDGE